MAIGQVAFGLLPWERKLVDCMMEDTFRMAVGVVRLIEALNERKSKHICVHKILITKGSSELPEFLQL